MACFFEVFRTLLKCSPIWAQKANACTILELSRLFWYPYHLWKWLSSGDIAVFKIFLQIFLLQRHLVTVFHKWKINFKVFLIDLVPFRYFFHAFWWPNQKKCLVDFSRDTSLWKESTENLSVWEGWKEKWEFSTQYLDKVAIIEHKLSVIHHWKMLPCIIRMLGLSLST